jgi:hypothetical protein
MSFRRFFFVRLGWAVFGLWLAVTLVFLITRVLVSPFLAIAVHFVVDVIVGALDSDLRAEWPVAGMPRHA